MPISIIETSAVGSLDSSSLPTGSLLQVVQATSNTTMQTSTASTWHDLAPTVTITPESSSNKILVSHNAGMMQYETPYTVMFRLLRNSTEVVQIGRVYTNLASGKWEGYIAAFEYLDSPATTSSVTYKWQLQMENVGQIRHNNTTGSFTATAITIAKEIAG